MTTETKAKWVPEWETADDGVLDLNVVKEGSPLSIYVGTDEAEAQRWADYLNALEACAEALDYALRRVAGIYLLQDVSIQLAKAHDRLRELRP